MLRSSRVNVLVIRQTLCCSRSAQVRGIHAGMMDTILNLGLNDDTVMGLAQRAQDERFAWIAIAALSKCTQKW